MKKTKHILLAFFMLAFSIQIIKAQCELTVTNFIVEPYPCDAVGNFMVDLDFDYSNAIITDSFTLEVNGVSYGDFAYANLFITVGPFNGDGVTDVSLIHWSVIPPKISSLGFNRSLQHPIML